MLKSLLVLVFLALPDFMGDCLTATDPHIPASNRVDNVKSRYGRAMGPDGDCGDQDHDPDGRCRCCGLLGRAPGMLDVLELCDQIAPTEFTVLITGETGTGKDLLARCIHLHSPRASRRMTPVACAALPENLLESELFGHKRGSFTGAFADRPGLIEQAHGGTLFLDEVDALTLAMQAKLLRAVEERRIQRVGASHDIPADFRLIAATNADLEAMVESGEFRSDLYYRLNVVHVRIPPLRERVEDVPRLAHHFRDHFAHEAGIPVVPFSRASLEWMLAHEWPGNIRQLKHAVERGSVLSRGADRIEPTHLDDGTGLGSDGADGALIRHIVAGWNLRQLEDQYIRAVVKHTGGHKGQAARLLGIDRRTLYRRLEALSGD